MPPGFRRDLVAVVAAALSELRDDKWVISEIEWEDELSRTVRFNAKKGAEGVYIVCFEKDLVWRLQSLL